VHGSDLDDGTRAVVRLPSIAIGRGEYLPGWRWSRHAGPQTGRLADRHVGDVLSGTMRVRSAKGEDATSGRALPPSTRP